MSFYQSRVFNWSLLTITSLIWGTSYILIKKGLVVFTPVEVALLRMVFAFVALIPLMPWGLKKVDKKLLGQVLLVALTGSVIPPFLFNYAQTEISSALTGILNSLTPLFTLVIGAMVYRVAFSGRKTLGVTLGLIGAVWLVYAGSPEIEKAGWIYPMLVIFAGICYGFGGNIVKSRLGAVHPLTITTLVFIIIGPPAFVALCFTQFFEKVNSAPGAMQALGFVSILGIFGTAYALVLFNKLVHNTNALFASTVTYLIPVVAIFWGLLDGEKLELYHFAGLGLILSGVYITGRSL